MWNWAFEIHIQPITRLSGHERDRKASGKWFRRDSYFGHPMPPWFSLNPDPTLHMQICLESTQLVGNGYVCVLDKL